MMLFIILAIALVFFLAMDPVRKLNEENNLQRVADLETILSALEDSSLADLTPGKSYVLGAASAGCDLTCGAQDTEPACLDLSADLPVDPVSGTKANSDYFLILGEGGDLTVGACDPDSEGLGGGGTVPVIEIVR